MQTMVFVRTRYIGERGRVSANLANTTLQRGSCQTSYDHAMSVSDNHRAVACLWVTHNMPLINDKPIGVQSYDNGYIFAFAAN